ncbi:tetratricopeptide repeat protein [bacterium]|nr:tetratricopeptide repeat protein [bacterium]
MKTGNHADIVQDRNSISPSITSQPANSPLVLADAAAQAGDIQRALTILKAAAATDAITNARGVCLMRQGRFDAALNLYRSLVVNQGCTWMREETPVIYRTNYCTALLLAGHPDGCVELLDSISAQTHPSVVRLRHSLNAWRSGLSLWQRLQWKLGLLPAVPVHLGFPPGDMLDPISAPRTDNQITPAVPPKQAV